MHKSLRGRWECALTPSAALGRGILFRGSLRVAATTNIDWEGVRDRIPVLVVRHNFSTCYFVENAQALVCSNIFLYASTYSKLMKSNSSANNVLSKCGIQHRDINSNMNVQSVVHRRLGQVHLLARLCPAVAALRHSPVVPGQGVCRRRRGLLHLPGPSL